MAVLLRGCASLAILVTFSTPVTGWHAVTSAVHFLLSGGSRWAVELARQVCAWRVW